MPRKYQRRTGQRRQDERTLAVRAVHRPAPDAQKLTDLLLRLSLQQSGKQRVEAELTAQESSAGAHAQN